MRDGIVATIQTPFARVGFDFKPIWDRYKVHTMDDRDGVDGKIVHNKLST
jgi:hypothetical protein